MIQLEEGEGEEEVCNKFKSLFMGLFVWIIVSIRLFACFSTQTSFVPDEFFQSAEVAHHVVFQQGTLTWEWTVEKPVRSVVHMLLFAGPLKILQMIGKVMPSPHILLFCLFIVFFFFFFFC